MAERRYRNNKLLKRGVLAFSGVWFANSELIESDALASIIDGIGFTPKELVLIFIAAHWMTELKKSFRSVSEKLDELLVLAGKKKEG